MTWNFQEIQEGMQKEVAALATEEQLEAFRVKFLGRKGVIAEIYDSLANLSKEEKPVVGKKANELRAEINRLLEIKKQEIKEKKVLGEPLDVTIPGVVSPVGHKHILTQTIDEICGLFESMGFIVREGPEIETEFNNFAALNIPLDHPSRDAFDTFYLQE